MRGMEEALWRISQWAKAYPLEVFPDQDIKRADEVLRAAGISMSAMHGQWARHIVKGIAEIADAALAHGSAPGTGSCEATYRAGLEDAIKGMSEELALSSELAEEVAIRVRAAIGAEAIKQEDVG